MFGWIPILGPIIDGIVSIFIKQKDTELGKYQEDTKVDVATIKAYSNIIESTKDDVGVRLARDIIILPVAIWTALISWDTIVIREYPNLVFIVEKYPDSVSYLPGAVLAFLLGNIGLNIWRRK